VKAKEGIWKSLRTPIACGEGPLVASEKPVEFRGLRPREEGRLRLRQYGLLCVAITKPLNQFCKLGDLWPFMHGEENKEGDRSSSASSGCQWDGSLC
jgi:hypothetical protein